MKQRSKILTALFLSASLAVTPAASVSVLAENLDVAAVEDVTVVPEEEISDSTDDSDLTEDIITNDSYLTDEDFAADASAFSADEADVFTADDASVQDDTEAKTHTITISVTSSEGTVSGMYAMDDAVVTRQENGTYLVRMHQKNENREYMALTNDKTAATQHRVDWYVADSSYYYTIPVTSLTEPVYASFSKASNVETGKAWGNVMTITFDSSSMADTDKNDAAASDINKKAALDYSSVDAALASVPEDLSVYTDESAAAVTSAVDVLKGEYKAAEQSDIDKLAANITDAVNALVKKEAQALTLTVTNQTAMFNVEKAVLGDGKLIVTLHGQGYHYLYKGTYEQAVANGDNRDNWIAGEQVDGQWQFTIPVAEGETYLPIVAISNSYLTKYEQGANTLERAFYPRQAVIDKDAATLVTGDYDHTADLTVSNSVKMFKVDAASLQTIGGPNSNNYQEVLHLTMGSDSFDKVFIGSADDAAKAETTTDITERKADLVVKANAMGGATTTDYLDKDVIFSFHSVKNGTWYERVFNVSKTNGTLTVTPVPEVYPATKVTLNVTSQKLTTGKSFTLKATVAPSNTTDTIVWKSSNPAVATVSTDGTVKAVKAGNAVITATAGKVSATCKVTVANPVYKVTSIKLTAAPSRSIAAGRKVQLRATVAPSKATNKAVTWKSSNTKVATVSSTGVVTFKKNAGGKRVVITATAKDGSKKYAKITLACMKGSVKAIKLSGKTTVKAGQTTKVTAKVTTQNGSANRSLAWSSSNTKLATVDKYGKVKTIKGKKGTVTITARATDGSGKKASIKIRIK